MTSAHPFDALPPAPTHAVTPDEAVAYVRELVRCAGGSEAQVLAATAQVRGLMLGACRGNLGGGSRALRSPRPSTGWPSSQTRRRGFAVHFMDHLTPTKGVITGAVPGAGRPKTGGKFGGPRA